MAVNVAFAILTTFGVLWLTRLSTASLAPLALALFLAVRRYSASLSALANLGGPLFQVRYMGMHAGDRAFGDLITLFVTAVFLVVSVVLCVGLLFAKDVLTRFFIPGLDYPSWFLWFVLLMAVEQLLHFSAQVYLLVKRRLIVYNIYKFLSGTALFFPVFLWRKSVSAESALTGYLVAAGVLLTLAHGFITIGPALRWRRLPWARLSWIAREAAAYGPPRAVVNFLDSLLFVLPAWLIRNDTVEMGFVLTIFVFVQATSIITLPINELAMVASAVHIGTGDKQPMKRMGEMLFKLLSVLSAAVVAVLYPFHAVVFRAAIGSDDVRIGVENYAPLLLCIIPITVYSGLKGIIEIQWKEPRNLLNLGVSQGIGLICFFVLRARGWTAASAILTASSSCFWAIGGLTVLSIRSHLRRLNWRAIGGACAIVGGAGAANVVLARLLASTRVPWATQLLLIAASGAVTVGAALRSVDPSAWQYALDRISGVLKPGGRRSVGGGL